MEALVRKIFTDPKNPSAFSSIDNVFRQVKKAFPKATRSQVKDILRGLDSYTMHRPVRHNFRKVKTIGESFRSHAWCDLLDVQKIASWNDDIRFLLVLVDGYSRFLWVEPLLNKKPESVLKALKKIFVDFMPHHFVVDEGSEWKSVVKTFLEENDVKICHPHSPHKSYRSERMIRTIRARMHRFFTQNRTWRYVDVLPDIVNGLNNTKHSATGLKPSQVTYKTWIPTQTSKPDGAEKAKIGDHVRLSLTKGTFHKGFNAGWTEQIYKVKRIFNTMPPMYEIEDLRGEVLEGRVGGHEIQVIKKPEVFRVEKILGYKTINKKKYAIVKWVGYDDSFNSVEPVANIINLQ